VLELGWGTTGPDVVVEGGARAGAAAEGITEAELTVPVGSVDPLTSFNQVSSGSFMG
jgi:hypothetical protein